MDIEILGLLGLLGLALATTGLATIVYQRRMDVLYGPYIQNRAGGSAGLLMRRFWNPASSAIDRLLALESQRMPYLTASGAY
jgi:hypothetical protein